MQAHYWDSPVTRREIQTSLDEIADTIRMVAAGENAMSLSLAYIFERLKITPVEFEAFLKARMEKAAASVAAPSVPAPEPNNIVVPG
jgi:hypothetical protein